jgi:hypothetical protein
LEGETLLNEISDLCSENRIIPFLGAGCSAPQLNCDWDSLMEEIAEQYKISEKGNLETAQSFINKYGKDSFCELLKERLSIEVFDDVKGHVFLAIKSMAFGLIYTTNQDNVMEKCCEKYGYKYKTIITLEDLISADIGQGLYIKYHGDYNIPNSVVFGEDDYLDRIENNNYFIDVKLKSDMLGRKLLFIGYGLRDMNLKLFLREVKSVHGTMPESYMIVWELTDNFKLECEKYNIKIVDPKEIFPEDEIEDAFLKTVNKLNDLVVKKKLLLQMDGFFNHKIAQKVVSKHEIDTLCRLLGEIDNKEFIEKFRSIMAAAFIPEDIEEEVVKLFIRLCKACNEDDIQNLDSLMFGLKISNDFNKFVMMIYFYIAFNSKQKEEEIIFGYSEIRLSTYPQELIGIAMAVAFDILTKNGMQISDYYRGPIGNVIDRTVNVDDLPDEINNYISDQFNKCWKQKYTQYENPIKRQLRLKHTFRKEHLEIGIVCEMYKIVFDRNKNQYYEIMNL